MLKAGKITMIIIIILFVLEMYKERRETKGKNVHVVSVCVCAERKKTREIIFFLFFNYILTRVVLIFFWTWITALYSRCVGVGRKIISPSRPLPNIFTL